MSVVSARPAEPDGIFGRLVECLTPEVASRILEVRLQRDIQARVDVLAERANDGELTAGERAEYEALIEKADLLAIFKSLAREVLARQRR